MDKGRIVKGSADEYINMLVLAGLPYKMIVSNYTIKIESDLFNQHFMRNQQNNKTFAAFAKLKKDLKNFPVPEISRAENFYFEHDFKKGISLDVAYSIDLKSAYATSLMMRNVLSADTYNYLTSLPKEDRLAAVGMLASRKDIFEFNSKNQIVKYETVVSEFEGFFYQCVRDTYEVIRYSRFLAESTYLYSWVDCIYLNSNVYVSDITDFLTANGYNFTIEKLQRFKVQETPKGMNVSFWKEGKEVSKFKTFNLPANRYSLAKELTQSLLAQHNLNDNYQKIRFTGRANK